MEINGTSLAQITPEQLTSTAKPTRPAGLENGGHGAPDARQAFDSFVGETFYSQMLKALHKAEGKPAYFHGGRAEEVFRGQLDQILATKLTEANASDLSGSMFDLFSLPRA